MNINGKQRSPRPSSLSKTKNSNRAIPKENPINKRRILNNFFNRMVLAPILFETSDRLVTISNETKNDNIIKS